MKWDYAHLPLICFRFFFLQSLDAQGNLFFRKRNSTQLEYVRLCTYIYACANFHLYNDYMYAFACLCAFVYAHMLMWPMYVCVFVLYSNICIWPFAIEVFSFFEENWLFHPFKTTRWDSFSHSSWKKRMNVEPSDLKGVYGGLRLFSISGDISLESWKSSSC